MDRVRALVIDMDGVLWRGSAPLPGLRPLFAVLRSRRLPFVLATNNASQPPEVFVERLAAFGVRVGRDEVLTSAQATALELARRSPGGGRVFAIGDEGVRRALEEAGFTLIGPGEVDADYVVCGMDRGLTWDKLAAATLNIRAGATFVGTNPDLTFPTERGLVHGNGAVLAALQAATGVAPEIVGKPEPGMYRMAAAILGADPAGTVAVGDRLDTDVLGAVRAGMRSVLVLSGVTTPADLAASTVRPTWVMQDVAELARALEQAAA